MLDQTKVASSDLSKTLLFFTLFSTMALPRCLLHLCLLASTINAFTIQSRSHTAVGNAPRERASIGIGAKNCRYAVLLQATTARNGIVFDDITLGQGRRILPGDTVYCYYVGSFEAAKAAANPAENFLGGFLGGKPDSTSDQETVFDSVSKLKI
jgi:hypothetical protein